jgi:rhamnosyl/mannosyltransferase
VIVSSPPLAAQSAIVRFARRVAVIPFGIALDRYRQSDRVTVDAIRGRTKGPRLLFVGRLVYYKGLHVLLDAMREWPGSLVIVGDGPLEDELRRQASALAIADRVLFAGRVAADDLPAYYHACDAFVLPSVARTEAFGVVQIEAMASGLPVISTGLPTGVPWVNKDGVSGLVVPPSDVRSLGTALGRIGADADLRNRLAAGARQRADTLFSKERMVKSFKDLIESVVHGPERLAPRTSRAYGDNGEAA